jgi:hypothetical protein
MKRRSPILDHRQRAFALAVADPTSRAQEVAGYKPNRKNANRLLRDERVLAEIARMRRASRGANDTRNDRKGFHSSQPALTTSPWTLSEQGVIRRYAHFYAVQISAEGCVIARTTAISRARGFQGRWP